MLFTYPVVTGKMNYVTMGGSFGMRARQVYPVGTVVIAVPSNLLPIIIDNLKRMPLVIPTWEMGCEAWIPAEGKIYAGLIKDAYEAAFSSMQSISAFTSSGLSQLALCPALASHAMGKPVLAAQRLL